MKRAFIVIILSGFFISCSNKEQTNTSSAHQKENKKEKMNQTKELYHKVTKYQLTINQKVSSGNCFGICGLKKIDGKNNVIINVTDSADFNYNFKGLITGVVPSKETIGGVLHKGSLYACKDENGEFHNFYVYLNKKAKSYIHILDKGDTSLMLRPNFKNLAK